MFLTSQVRNFGFNETVGLLSFKNQEEGAQVVGLRPYSDRLTETMDDEANKLIFSAYKRTEELLQDNMEKLKLVRINLQLFIIIYLCRYSI